MKQPILMLFLIVAGMLGVGLAQANILIISDISAKKDTCTQLGGTWAGEGTISSWGTTCQYHGKATLTPSARVDSVYPFTMNIQLKKDSETNNGNYCPSEKTVSLEGSCQQGNIVLNASSVHLSGELSPGGSVVNMIGTIDVDMGFYTLTADVKSMHLWKET
jgi:hypothetical protein